MADLLESKARVFVLEGVQQCDGAVEVPLDGLCAGSHEAHRADFALAQLADDAARRTRRRLKTVQTAQTMTPSDFIDISPNVSTMFTTVGKVMNRRKWTDGAVLE